MISMNIKIALAALKSAPVRTILTMVGIVIGVASVTLIMAMGEGIKQQIGNEITRFGNNIVQIRPGKPADDAAANNFSWLASLGASTLTDKDVETAKRTPGVAAAAPFMLVTGNISYGDREVNNPVVIATSSELPDVVSQKMTSGEFFYPGINKEVVVIGRNVANTLFGVDNQLGGKIKIRGTDFTVIGVMEGQSDSTSIGGITPPNFSDVVFIPYEAAKTFFGGSQIHEINVKLSQDVQAGETLDTLKQAIQSNHNGQEDFSIATQEETLSATNSIINLVATFTAAIASISLLVGGIGIMNIMLVSVSERTKEIGIRKSIGATNGQILSQFLIEAMVISIGGGLIGLGIAYGITGILTLRFELVPVITASAVWLAFGVSTGVGILFGMAPAIKAARKDPIDALRHE